MRKHVTGQNPIWLCVLVMIFALPSTAGILQYTGFLTGSQEVPSRATPATGLGFATLDDVALTLEVSLTWSDLLAPAQAAHIHCCPGPGFNGPVAVDFVPVGFPAATSGVFSHVFDLTAAGTYGGTYLNVVHGGDIAAARAALIAGLNADDAYFNIHTPVYPGGEIRGDIRPVPEPSFALLVAAIIGAMGAWNVRRLRVG